ELLAEIGKPETAVRIEHHIVRTVQRHAIAMRVQRLERAVAQIHALNAAAFVIGGFARGTGAAVVGTPTEAAVVAHITMSVWTDGRPVGPAAELRDRTHLAIRHHTRDATPGDLDHEYAAIAQRHWPFRKTQS